MANRYANLVGSNKIKDEWQKINAGFDAVQADMDTKADSDDLASLESTVTNHIGAGGSAHAAATTTEAGFMSADDKTKLDGVEPGAQVNQNAIAKINDVEADDPSDEVTIEGGTGITITTNPTEKKVIITATGEATPGPHGSSHTEHGADPIPAATTSEGGLMSAADKQMLESHASRHATGGPDEITPGMIGAAPEMHGSEHNHDGSDPIPDLVQLRDDFNVLIATGVIVESGENTNGQYVRFADGTQICWARKTGGNINLNISQQDYPYPAAFVSNPTTPFGVSMSFVVSDAVRNALLNSFVIGSNTQWSVRIPSEARTEDSADGATGYHLMAIGRWK